MNGTQISPMLRTGSTLLGISLIAIAALCLHNNDFAGQRQPVPLSWPLRPALIDINIAVLAIAGVALIVPRWLRYGAVAVAAWIGLWVLALHLPRLGSAEAAWLGLTECLAIAIAAARAIDLSAKRHAERALDWLYALCLFSFGAAHFIYVQITASMVPSWLPAPIFWACFTGAAHIAAGVSLITGLWTRLATRLLAVMLGSFAVLVNLPIALAKGGWSPTTIDLCFAAALTASAIMMAAGRPKGRQAS